MQKNTPFILFISVMFAMCIYVLWAVQSVLAPFVAGLILAYVCAPIVGFLVHKKVPRGLAVSSVMLGIISCITLIGLLIFPRLISELGQLITDLPQYAKTLKTRAETSQLSWLNSLLEGRAAEVQSAISTGIERLTQSISTIFMLLWTRGQSVLSGLMVFILTPIIAFYLLLDWPKLVVHLEQLIPRRWLPTWDKLSGDINAALKAYFQGQSLVCLCLALYYSTALSLIGLKYGFLIGILAGIFSFVPYVGSFGGFITAMLVAFTQFYPEQTQIWLVASVFVFGQVLEGYVLAPKLVGDKVGLHAVWIFFALFVFGALMGFSGLVLAVPLAAVIGVCVRHGVKAYRASEYYKKVK